MSKNACNEQRRQKIFLPLRKGAEEHSASINHRYEEWLCTFPVHLTKGYATLKIRQHFYHCATKLFCRSKFHLRNNFGRTQKLRR